MKKLDFNSEMLKTERYSKDFYLPDFLFKSDGSFDKEKTLALLADEEYGVIDDKGVTVSVIEKAQNEIEETNNGYRVAGKAYHRTLLFTIKKGEQSATFPVEHFVPSEFVCDNPEAVGSGRVAPVKMKQGSPTIVNINFADESYTKYLPLEELLDNNVSVAHFNYGNVTKDNRDFSDGIAAFMTDRSKENAGGKIALWAFACNVVGEFLVNNGYADKDNVYIAGHSRLGKTALWACATSKVYSGCIANNSGAGGAAIFREKRGESLERVYNLFDGAWFCPGFKKYFGKEASMPFDQHYLLACVAPRLCLVNTAYRDTWADTEAQYLCCEAASEIWEKYGEKGLVGIKSTSLKDKKSLNGKLGFTNREGLHCFSRQDWLAIIEFLKEHKKL